MNTIKEYLTHSPLLFDGGMGTYYHSIAKQPLERCEYANIKDENSILRIHKDYIDAGAKAIKTNSFSLAQIAQEEGLRTAETLAKAAWSIAETAVDGKDIFLFADFGPPAMQRDDTFGIYQSLIDTFLRLGAKHFIFETFLSDTLIRPLATYLREVSPDAYILASFAILPDGFTAEGFFGPTMVDALLAEQIIDAGGFNCVSGPAHLLARAREMQAPGKTLSIMPNAGYPTVIGGRTIYQSSTTYFAERLAEMAALGVNILGGCCGTDPSYIRETAKLLQTAPPAIFVSDTPQKTVVANAEAPSENAFRKKLLSGEKIIAVELDSPLDSSITQYMSGAADLKKMGADIITIADCPVARSRMDSSIVACKLKRELGIDALPHLTCRDRNINATRALLLGLSAEGIHNVLIVTGDPIPTAERDEVKSVFNFHARMLIRYVSELNQSVFRTPFFIGGALNVNAVNFDAQLRLAEEKSKNGAGVLLTQPIMTAQAVHNLRRAKSALDAKILGGIMPLVSHRNAQFIASEIQGMAIDPETVEQFAGKSKEQSAELGIALSLEIAKEIQNDIDGFYLVTPFARTDIIVSLMEKIKNL